MKQFLSLVAVGLLGCCLSCNNEQTANDAKDTSMAEKNLAVMHIVIKAFDTGDPSAIDSVVAADFVDHTDQGDVGRDSLKAMIVSMHAKTTDSKSEIIKELADDDYAMSWVRYTGSTDGSMGIPAGPYDMTAIEVVKFKDGMATEHWAFMEPRELMKMMNPGAMEGSKMDDKMSGK